MLRYSVFLYLAVRFAFVTSLITAAARADSLNYPLWLQQVSYGQGLK